MSVFANNRFLKRVNPEIVRAKDDSGSSLNHPEIQKLMRQMVDLDIADNLKLWVHNGLVKTRTSGSDTFVSKAYDISGEENDAVQATNDNQPELVSDGMEFDGSDDYLDCGADGSFDISSQITVLGWVKAAFSVFQVVAAKQDFSAAPKRGWYLRKGYSGNTGFHVAVIDVVGGNIVFKGYESLINVFDNNDYHHIGFTFSPNSLKLFHNGSEDTDANKRSDDEVNSININSDIEVLIGAYYGTSSQLDRHYNGTLNDIRIFNKALSATEISAIFNATKGFYGIT